MKIWLACAVLSMAMMAQSAEQTIVKYLDDHQNDGLALLEKAVNIDSGTGNHAGVKKVGEIGRAHV